jgi:hypothetical protein
MPIHHSAYDAKWQDDFGRLDEIMKTNIKKGKIRYDARSKPLSSLQVSTQVLVQDCSGVKPHRWTIHGEIMEKLQKGEYLIKLPSGRIIRRSRVHIRVRQLMVGPSMPVTEPMPRNNIPNIEDQIMAREIKENGQNQKHIERRSNSVPACPPSSRFKTATKLFDPQVWDLKRK